MQIPSCTYRIQFNPRFRFTELATIADYLTDLGITAIYASPVLRPTTGSEHGYDGIDVNMLNPEIGTEEEMQQLSAELQQKGMCWIQDIVPNHMAFHMSNSWLNDVLERGSSSPYAGHFDIDWTHPFSPGKLMVPFLEADLETCLREKKIKLAFQPERGFCMVYYGNNYPVRIDTYYKILQGLGENPLLSAALSSLVGNPEIALDHWNQLKKAYLDLLQEHAMDGVLEKVAALNKDPSALLELLQGQHYVLCYHATSHVQINYRRFFNVNGLICLRMEDRKVFDDYHRYIASLYEKGIIHGLRIDHIDGLKNPGEYVRWLRELFGQDCYIIVEKILDVKEELPATMQIQGTSGYEFLSYINQVLTDSKGAEQLLEIYMHYVPMDVDYDTIVFRNKLANLETYLNGEWDNLLRYLLSLNLIEDPEVRLPDLKMALGVFMASFPVYRVYVEQLPMNINEEQLLVLAFVNAGKRFPSYSYQLGLLRQLFEPHPDPVRNMNRLAFVKRLMQFTGPLAAKGVEDTTFYQYNPLISHNEVGDQPCVLGIPVRVFHEKMQERLQKNSLSLNCTSTHDTKRGEDSRVRINVLSELAPEWGELVASWKTAADRYRKRVGDVVAPIANDEYFLYQAIAGGFPEDLEVTPAFIERTKRYFVKVLRESKHMSDHVSPNLAYEEACMEFIDALLKPESEFLLTFLPFVSKLIRYANIYSMVQVIIKLTAPGIPDIYQGCELWDLSYVDPDNRRPVNFDTRRKALAFIRQKENADRKALLEWAAKDYARGMQKMLVTVLTLQLRNRYRSLFQNGMYMPVYAEGSDRIVIAYIRKAGTDWILIVLPVGIVSDSNKSLNLILPEESPVNWVHQFSGEKWEGHIIAVDRLFQEFPVAVLVGKTNE